MASVAVPRGDARAVARAAAAVRATRRLPLYVLLLVGAVTMLFPFVWMVSTSLKQDVALFVTPPKLIPSPVETHNYSRVAELIPIWRIAFNSVLVAVISTTLQLVTSAMGAYAFARLQFRGRDALFLVYLATLMVPFQVTIVPLFVEMKYL